MSAEVAQPLAVCIDVRNNGTSSMSSFHGIDWQFSPFKTPSVRTVLGFVFGKRKALSSQARLMI